VSLTCGARWRCRGAGAGGGGGGARRTLTHVSSACTHDQHANLSWFLCDARKLTVVAPLDALPHLARRDAALIQRIHVRRRHQFVLAPREEEHGHGARQTPDRRARGPVLAWKCGCGCRARERGAVKVRGAK
jgi:hypothetical protein